MQFLWQELSNAPASTSGQGTPGALVCREPPVPGVWILDLAPVPRGGRGSRSADLPR